MLLAGLRKEEGIRSFNLIIFLGEKLSREYYNEEKRGLGVFPISQDVSQKLK
jgi:hypothetical protein